MSHKVISAYGKKTQLSIQFDPDSGLTKQSFKDECDINNILAKYQKTGAIAHANNHAPEYGFATAQNFTDSMFIVTTAQRMFNDLPSSLRDIFNNDPAQYLDFVQNPDNEAEMVELGLKPRPYSAVYKDSETGDKVEIKETPAEKAETK